jgi:hypothetical protein
MNSEDLRDAAHSLLDQKAVSMDEFAVSQERKKPISNRIESHARHYLKGDGDICMVLWSRSLKAFQGF